MSAIYLDRRTFREAMRRANGPERLHAICRKLVATASQSSHWYGAHYWAAGSLLSDIIDRDTLRRDLRCFAYEYRHAIGQSDWTHEQRAPRAARRLFWRAYRRVKAIRAEAIALPNSLLW
jgi:hypothetical protein